MKQVLAFINFLIKSGICQSTGTAKKYRSTYRQMKTLRLPDAPVLLRIPSKVLRMSFLLQDDAI